MKLYEIGIRPRAPFGTPLKGDTLFGHYCWQAAYDTALLNGGLKARLESYAEEPFVVFSSAFVKVQENGETLYALKRPDLPLSTLFPFKGMDRKEILFKRKEFKKKQWMLIGGSLAFTLNGADYIDDQTLLKRADETAKRALRKQEANTLHLVATQPHNTINRFTGTTGSGDFAPFVHKNRFYSPGIALAIFVLLEEGVTNIEKVQTAMDRIGKTGFGRDASTGLGRFEVSSCEEIPLPVSDSANACYCLSPVVPEKENTEYISFVPFVRFGKHGDSLAVSPNPFKNPVVMADEGAVVVPKSPDAFNKPYIGQAVTGVSKVQPETVVQGYSIYLPFSLEM